MYRKKLPKILSFTTHSKIIEIGEEVAFLQLHRNLRYYFAFFGFSFQSCDSINEIVTEYPRYIKFK